MNTFDLEHDLIHPASEIVGKLRDAVAAIGDRADTTTAAAEVDRLRDLLDDADIAAIQAKKGAAAAEEEHRRAGAVSCLTALRQMIAGAQDMPNDAAGFFSKQHGDAQAFVASLGPMPPYAEGALIALAEYIHHLETTGDPNLDVWKPEAAKTKAERKRDIAAMVRAWEEDDRRATHAADATAAGVATV